LLDDALVPSDAAVSLRPMKNSRPA
jgi:hypothetical protein